MFLLSKTKMRKIFFILISIGLLISVGLIVSGCTAPPVSNNNDTIEVDREDQTCEQDDDCILAMVKCSCDCGVPINEKHWSKYLDEQKKMCENYQGKMCKMDCGQELKCEDNICIVSE